MNLIARQFAKIGARAKVNADLGRSAQTGVSIDIGHDELGEFFDIAIGRDAPDELAVLGSAPADPAE